MRMPNDEALRKLARLVQSNADLADSVFAQSSPLCIYLLDMREYFRWNQQLPLGETLPRAALGEWIRQCELHWESLREADPDGEVSYRPLLPDLSDDPFETDLLRDRLIESGLVYGAGIGRFGRPQFFLGKIIGHEVREGFDVFVCGEELARGLTAPPAMSRGNTVLIRQDAFERWVWTRYEEWQLHPRDGGFGIAWKLHAEAEAALAQGEVAPERVARRVALAERESLILHELGERQVDHLLGDAWHDLIDALPGRKAELLARSVRDLLADCTVTLPVLLERDEALSIHFWFGLVDGLRLKLAGGMVDDYRRWCRGDSFDWPKRLAEAADHWQAVAGTLMSVWQDEGAPGIECLLAEDRLIFC